MNNEFEGKTVDEAVENAIETLHIDRADFTVEVLSETKKGLFRKGNVRIRVTIDGAGNTEEENNLEETEKDYAESEIKPEKENPVVIKEELVKSVVDFTTGLLNVMGAENPYVMATNINPAERKFTINIEADDCGYLIGHNGKTLEALQVIVNSFVSSEDIRVILDVEDYRERQDEKLQHLALMFAKQVRRTGKSFLFDPMNPYERWVVHSALSDFDGVTTESEGEGSLKRLRIIPTRK